MGFESSVNAAKKVIQKKYVYVCAQIFQCTFSCPFCVRLYPSFHAYQLSFPAIRYPPPPVPRSEGARTSMGENESNGLMINHNNWKAKGEKTQ